MEKVLSKPVIEKVKTFTELYQEHADARTRRVIMEEDAEKHKDLKEHGLFDLYTPNHHSLDAAVEAIENHMLNDPRFESFTFNFTSPKHVFAIGNRTASIRVVENFPFWPDRLETISHTIRALFIARTIKNIAKKFLDNHKEFNNKNGHVPVVQTTEWDLVIVLE